MPELTRRHLKHFAFNGHTAVPDEVAAMAKELMDGRARIAELEKTCQGWSDAHEISKANHRARVSYLSARRAELEAWKQRQIAQGRRAITDPHRFRRIFDPEQPDLAIVIDTVLDERDALRSRTAELEAALAKAHAGIADASTAIGVAAEDVAQSDAVVTAGRVRLAELEAELRDEGNRSGRLADQLRTACAEGAAANARLAELETELESLRTRIEELAATRNPDDDVLVEGSWFHPADLPRILGNYMRGSDEDARKWKDAAVELHAASARVAELEQHAGQSLGYVVVAEQPVHRAAVMHRFRAIGCIWPDSEGAEIQLAERSDRALMDPAWFSGVRHFIAELREVSDR